MQYFGIQTTKDYKDVGNVSTQAYLRIGDNPLLVHDELTHLWYSHFESPQPVIMQLDKKAILTDVLTHPMSNKLLLANERFLNILNNFSLQHFDKIAITIQNKKLETFRYYLINPLKDIMDSIDYKNCAFELFEYGKSVNKFKVESAKELALRKMKALGKNVYPVDNKLQLLPNITGWSDDMILFSLITQERIFVSKELNNAIKKEKITGIDFTNTIIELNP